MPPPAAPGRRRLRRPGAALCSAALRGAAACAALRLTAPGVPSFAALRAAHRPSDIRILDRHGTVVHEIRVDPTRRRLPWVPLAAVSPALPAAVVAAEDRRYRSHAAVDLRALGAAALQRLRGRGPRGASTITMQLAGLLDPAAGRGTRSLREKWRQIRVARALERAWTKDEILEAYLNLVPFRGELEGIGAAAAALFGKAPHGLTRPESLVLAALLAAPGAPPEAVARRALRLAAAVPPAPGPEDIDAAVGRALRRAGTAWRRRDLAPHVARRVARRSADAPATVATTLDADLQAAATAILRRHLLALRERNVHDGAVLVADTATGDILAWVGSSGPLSRAPEVDAVLARRQAGSTLKPLLYALAIDRRLLTAATRLDDTPVEIPVGDGLLYRPVNYDREFRGPLSVRAALAGSLNVPAVRALGLVGADAFLAHLRHLGFGGLVQPSEHYGPALALGSAEVSLRELVGAYRTLATGGLHGPLRVTPGGTGGTAAERIYAPGTAFIVADILADRQSRAWTFGLDSPFDRGGWTAVKTGTSTDMRDNWCVGFSDRVTVGVWVGNASGGPMRDVSGLSGAAPVWAELMARIHAGRPAAPPTPPAGVVRRAVRFRSGPEPPRDEWFLEHTEPPAPAPDVPGPARITAPAEGTVIAVDPDIPAGRQQLSLGATGDLAGVTWWIDGRPLGPARGLDLWRVEPGTHELALRDARGSLLDRVRFAVRHPGPR